MATIEERAKDFADKGLPNNIEGAIRYTYIYAANEQQKIDIDKACEWIQENIVGTNKYMTNCCGIELIKTTAVDDFRKAMEE